MVKAALAADRFPGQRQAAGKDRRKYIRQSLLGRPIPAQFRYGDEPPASESRKENAVKWTAAMRSIPRGAGRPGDETWWSRTDEHQGTGKQFPVTGIRRDHTVKGEKRSRGFAALGSATGVLARRLGESPGICLAEAAAWSGGLGVADGCFHYRPGPGSGAQQNHGDLEYIDRRSGPMETQRLRAYGPRVRFKKIIDRQYTVFAAAICSRRRRGCGPGRTVLARAKPFTPSRNTASAAAGAQKIPGQGFHPRP